MSDPERRGYYDDALSGDETEEEEIFVTFGGVVSPDTLVAAGFNYAEPATLFDRGGNLCSVYIVDENEYNPNIIVIEERLDQGRSREARFYFGTFPGTPVGQRRGEEVDRYMEQVRGIITPENEVFANELEDIIDSFVMGYKNE